MPGRERIGLEWTEGVNLPIREWPVLDDIFNGGKSRPTLYA